MYGRLAHTDNSLPGDVFGLSEIRNMINIRDKYTEVESYPQLFVGILEILDRKGI